MPYILLNKLEAEKSERNPLDGSELKSLSQNEHEDLDEHILSDLVQWSDLIMFDYLTGNYDRVASMQVSIQVVLLYYFSYEYYAKTYIDLYSYALSYATFCIIRMVQIMKSALQYFMKLFITLPKALKPSHYGCWTTNLPSQMRIHCYTLTEVLQKRMLKGSKHFTKICWKQPVSSDERLLTDYMLYIRAPILLNCFFNLCLIMSLYSKQDYQQYIRIHCSCNTSRKE